MNLLDRTKKICQEEQIKPSRNKGQNFLIDDSYYDEIIRASNLQNTDVVLEVGPGLGFLTEKIAKKSAKLITVELDETIQDYIKRKKNKEKIENLELVRKNILDLEPEVKYNKIIANLPYNITSRFLQIFLSTRARPDFFVLMLQKEVVDRICAKPGKMSLLGISVQYFSSPELICNVPKNVFWPEPKVDSAVVKLVCNKEAFVEKMKPIEKEFFRLVKIGFSSKRKMLKNNLTSGYQISQKQAEEYIIKSGLDAKVRAQELSLENWLKLLGSF